MGEQGSTSIFYFHSLCGSVGGGSLERLFRPKSPVGARGSPGSMEGTFSTQTGNQSDARGLGSNIEEKEELELTRVKKKKKTKKKSKRHVYLIAIALIELCLKGLIPCTRHRVGTPKRKNLTWEENAIEIRG